jgi:hypothetical protein
MANLIGGIGHHPGANHQTLLAGQGGNEGNGGNITFIFSGLGFNGAGVDGGHVITFQGGAGSDYLPGLSDGEEHFVFGGQGHPSWADDETEFVAHADGKADNGLLYGVKVEPQDSANDIFIA